MSLRQFALNHPHVFFPSFCVVIAPFALRPDSTAFTAIALLSVLLIYIPILLRIDTSYRKSKGLLLVGILSAGSCVFRYQASRQALSTSATSLVSMFIVTTVLSLMGVASISISTKVSTRFASPWSRVALFPAIWATLWWTFSHINPVGYLATWSVANNSDAYTWISPYVGPAGKDWIVAAWAVVISDTMTQWFMEDNEGEYMPLLSTPTSQRSNHSNKMAIQTMGSFLVLLVVPYSMTSQFPTAISDHEVVTPLSVGCVLPSLQYYNKNVLTLDDYINESRQIQNKARIILWPEGAVTFHSAEERDIAFKNISEKLPGAYVGVSFEETITNPDDPTGKTSLTRTGLAVVSNLTKTLVHHTYYKRHLVPVAESYSLRPGTSPPTLSEIIIPRPKSIPKGIWGTARSLLLTSSICLDFAMPSPFEGLEAKPSLILAPARTWDRTVGEAMWLQAKQRAAELDTMILWCDGGRGGVSGIAGGGINEVTQVGSDSFFRTIAIPFPINPRRAFYARFGDLSLILMWLMVLGNPRPTISAAISLYRSRKGRAQPLHFAEGNLLDLHS